MFQIDDNFLTSIGYDVASLSDEKKQQYIDELTTELNARISDRLVSELSEDQVEEFNEIQENPDRAFRWLDEFHADYHDAPEYRQVLDGTGSESEAATFYASALWMRDAVPDYGQKIQQEFDSYHDQLVKLRQSVRDAAA